jgi:archaemetzincin
MQKMVYLQPIGSVDPEVLGFLKQNLFLLFPTKLLPQIELPKNAYDKMRGQFDGSGLLEALPEGEEAVLGVTEVNAYVDGLNFIFGLAGDRKALISLKRLRPEYYRLPEDEELFKYRVLKEAMHELGHVFGLNHCPDRNCVMYFSNSILDTDFRDWRYCGPCEWNLTRMQRGPG